MGTLRLENPHGPNSQMPLQHQWNILHTTKGLESISTSHAIDVQDSTAVNFCLSDLSHVDADYQLFTFPCGLITSSFWWCLFAPCEAVINPLRAVRLHFSRATADDLANIVFTPQKFPNFQKVSQLFLR